MYIEGFKKEWSASKSLNEYGLTKTVKVYEVDNGFVICMSKEGYKDESRDDYVSENKTFVSKDNPLADKDAEEKEDMSTSLDDVSELMSSISLI